MKIQLSLISLAVTSPVALCRLLLIVVFLIIVLLLILLGLALRIAILIVAEATVEVLVRPIALSSAFGATAARGLRCTDGIPPAASGVSRVHL